MENGKGKAISKVFGLPAFSFCETREEIRGKLRVYEILASSWLAAIDQFHNFQISTRQTSGLKMQDATYLPMLTRTLNRTYSYFKLKLNGAIMNHAFNMNINMNMNIITNKSKT